MVHLTRFFSDQAPLSPRLKSVLDAAFDSGWADPKKVNQAGSQAAILRNQALEELAEHLAISPDQIEPLGEPALGHYLAIAGLLTPTTPLTTSSVDVGKVRAVARAHQGPTHLVDVDSDGRYLNVESSPTGVISLQAVNGETGISQNIASAVSALPTGSLIALDATRAIPQPGLLVGSTTALFSATSWSGITGMGFLIISDRSKYRYPLPHIAPISTPGSYSLPLLMTSVVALAEYKSTLDHIRNLRRHLMNSLASNSLITVVGNETDSSSAYVSAVIDGYAAEEVLQRMSRFDIALDAGSACSPEDLTPSHVIAAMGLPTTGHIRIALHPHHSAADIDFLVAKLGEVLQ